MLASGRPETWSRVALVVLVAVGELDAVLEQVSDFGARIRGQDAGDGRVVTAACHQEDEGRVLAGFARVAPKSEVFQRVVCRRAADLDDRLGRLLLHLAGGI